MGWIKAVFAVLAVMLAGGCFFSYVPAMAPDQAEDVGEVLAFRIFFPAPDPDEGSGFRFRRTDGTRYRVYLFDSQGVESPASGEATEIVLIRRFGTRHGEPVYLIQVGPPEGEAPTPLVFGIVAIRADGIGVQKVFDCARPEFARLAAQVGLTVDCAPDAPHLVSVGGPGGDLSAFLQLTEDAGLTGWEDEMGISVYQEINQGL